MSRARLASNALVSSVVIAVATGWVTLRRALVPPLTVFGSRLNTVTYSRRPDAMRLCVLPAVKLESSSVESRTWFKLESTP